MHRPASVRLALATVLATVASWAGGARALAQTADSLDPLRNVIAATRPLTRVRVELRDGRRLTGTLGPVLPDALALRDSAGADALMPLADVTRLWRRGRATRRAAVYGGITGAALLGALFAALSGYCEDAGTGCEPSKPVPAFFGGAVFGGLLVGLPAGLVGAAIPQWREAWRSGAARSRETGAGAPVVVETRRDSNVAVAPTRRIGELTTLVTGGFVSFGATPDIGSSSGPGVGATLGLALRRGRVAFGPETGLLAGTGGSVWTIGGTGRVDLAHSAGAGRVRYLVVGAGANVWFTRELLFTASLGIGEMRRGTWRAEVRWNPVLQYSDPYNPHPTFLTIGVGRVMAW